MVSLPRVAPFLFADTGRSLTRRLPARLARFLAFMAVLLCGAGIASGVPRRKRRTPLEIRDHDRLDAAICPNTDGACSGVIGVRLDPDPSGGWADSGDQRLGA